MEVVMCSSLSPSLSEWLPQLNKVGRKTVDHTITEPLAPVLIKRYVHVFHTSLVEPDCCYYVHTTIWLCETTSTPHDSFLPPFLPFSLLHPPLSHPLSSSLPSPYHRAPFKLHLMSTGGSWTKWLLSKNKDKAPPTTPPTSLPQGPTMYDSVFVLSSGRVTSIGPQGEFNWQVSCFHFQFASWCTYT